MLTNCAGRIVAMRSAAQCSLMKPYSTRALSRRSPIYGDAIA
ncbi:hypothetical protein [Lysobacter gummosus]